MKKLTLAVRKEYFDQIKSGKKKWEYRMRTEYWEKRIVGKYFTHIEITLGYPKSGDKDRRLLFPWRKYFVIKKIHTEFGDYPVKVFAFPLILLWGRQHD